ncbi:hypothetical protein A2U01_0051096, partial [Trifolium medium]|nr:hypothetical protein [Trifolium medium]
QLLKSSVTKELGEISENTSRVTFSLRCSSDSNRLQTKLSSKQTRLVRKYSDVRTTNPRDNVLIGQNSSPQSKTSRIIVIFDGKEGFLPQMIKVREIMRKQAEVRMMGIQCKEPLEIFPEIGIILRNSWNL